MSQTLQALFASIVRTVVPIIVGSVTGWLVSLGIELDPEFESLLGVALTAVFTTVYYVVVRLLETYVAPKFGWLLLSAKKPVYALPEAVPVVEHAATLANAAAKNKE